ncbi:MAG: hypothetical protein H7Y38_01205, partial [Armatimonadetes bacterium]|nr:hypothetical protein [Armatimonadota bacterium]
VETTLDDDTYTISGDTRPEKGATMLSLCFHRKMTTMTIMAAERFPSVRTMSFTTVMILTPNGKPVPVGSNSSSDSNGMETKYQVTASLTFAPVAEAKP